MVDYTTNATKGFKFASEFHGLEVLPKWFYINPKELQNHLVAFVVYNKYELTKA